MKIKPIIATLVLIIAVVVPWHVTNTLLPTLAAVPAVSEVQQSPAPTITPQQLERALIRLDIQSIGKQIGLSDRQQNDYLLFLDSAAARYQIPMILLHAIVAVESNYDPSARHPQITITSGKYKGRKTYAIGLTGVVWEYHKDSLIAQGIAKSRLELTEPGVNIMASAYILNMYITDIMRQTPNLSQSRFFDELVRRYYGAYDERYKRSVMSRIRDTASKHWIQRVTYDIYLTFQTTKEAV